MNATTQAQKETPILEVKNLKMHFPLTKGLLNKQYGVVKAVDDVSFTLQAGKTLAWMGESAAAKPRLVNVFCRCSILPAVRSYIKVPTC